MLSTLLSQLVKNVINLPGWMPLLLIIYGAAHYADLRFVEDEKIEKLTKDTLVILVSFIAYQLGDAVDEALV